MPKKKPDHEKAKKISISIPRAIWNLAEMQMFQRRQGDSEYIRELIKTDTHDLWVQQQKGTLNFPLPADPAPKRSGNEIASNVQPIKAFYGRKKTDRKG